MQYDYFQDAVKSQFKAPWKHLCNIPRVYTAADTAVTTPNPDTPYSWLGLDRRSEPVLNVPPIEREHYFCIQLLVANPLDRYLLNSSMLTQLRRDEDGGLTSLIQKDSPGPEKEANWLPAPEGPFMLPLRMYWPKEEAIDGTWTEPPMRRAGT